MAPLPPPPNLITNKYNCLLVCIVFDIIVDSVSWWSGYLHYHKERKLLMHDFFSPPICFPGRTARLLSTSLCTAVYMPWETASRRWPSASLTAPGQSIASGHDSLWAAITTITIYFIHSSQREIKAVIRSYNEECTSVSLKSWNTRQTSDSSASKWNSVSWGTAMFILEQRKFYKIIFSNFLGQTGWQIWKNIFKG